MTGLVGSESALDSPVAGAEGDAAAVALCEAPGSAVGSWEEQAVSAMAPAAARARAARERVRKSLKRTHVMLPPY